VNGVFVERDKLVAQISKDQAGRSKVEDGASISVISAGSQSLQARNAIFMWFQLFIEVLLRMHHKPTDRKELMDICKKNYKGNHKEMKVIDEFEKTYKPENAIWWYTRESCFYRMMNKALRVQDFDMLFALRFFITDIAKQLKSEYEKFIRTSDTRNIIRVYRGQVIASSELELMNRSIGDFLSMNSFLSTSRNRSTALHFSRLTPVTDGTERIIFQIEIDPRSQTKAFSDVTKISYFENEDEVLIMLGALFRIEKVVEDKKERVWVGYVSLASEDDYHLKETFSYMKNTIGDETDLDSLGKILIQMGEPEQARKCYKRMIDERKLALGNAELGLGMASLDCGMDEESLEHLEEALRIRQLVLGQDHADVGECYSYMGIVHWCLRYNFEQALSNLKQAVKIQERALSSDSLVLAKTYHNLATTYSLMEKYDAALDYYNKALTIRQKVLPSNHRDIAMTYNNLGTLYEDRQDFSKALEYYQKSLEINHKILPPEHRDLVGTESNIQKLKGKMKK
jgi:tetratricopeptide (TPR) repeat protein